MRRFFATRLTRLEQRIRQRSSERTVAEWEAMRVAAREKVAAFLASLPSSDPVERSPEEQYKAMQDLKRAIRARAEGRR